jgi:hypothetical protein
MADDIDTEALAQEVLEHLGVVAVGQTPAEAVTAKAVKGVERAWDRLSENGVAPFSIDAIPGNAQDQMRDYCAGFLAQSFKVAADRVQQLKIAGEIAETLLAEQFEDDELTDEDIADSNPDYF